MFGLGERFGALLIAGALLFVALRLQKSGNKKAKNASIVAAFIAGLAALSAIVGNWMQINGLGLVAAAGLIVSVAIISVDWLMDKKPDRPAMWAAFALATMIVLGAGSLDAVGDQVSRSSDQVGEQMSQMGK